MAFSLRIPPDLDSLARQRADSIGVPLNSLICFALDQYLRGSVQVAPGQSVAPAPVLVFDDLDRKGMLGAGNGGFSGGGRPLVVPGQSKAQRRAELDQKRKEFAAAQRAKKREI